MYKLSLIIPCYNEAKNLPALIERITNSFNRPDIEVILVDNGSVDESPSILAKLIQPNTFIRSIRVEKNQGYGFGIISGLKAASGQFLGWTHADMQTDPADALRALEIIENENISGQVYVKGKRYGRPISDIVFTIGMSVFETLILGRTFWDINAQPNIFSRGLFNKLTDLPSDFSLDLSVYHQAKVFGATIKRFPVHFGKRLHGESHWNINWKSKIKFIRRTISFSFELKRRLGTL